MRFCGLLGSTITSGLLLYASAVPFDLHGLVWIALLPLLLGLHAVRRYWQAFALACITGAVFYGLHIRWVGAVATVPGVAFGAIVCYAALFCGVFGLGLLILLGRTRWPLLLIAPVLWVAVEFLRSNLSFLAIPFALLGYSQHANLPVLQLASLTSVYGLSFLIVLVNAALAETVLWWLGCSFRRKPRSRSRVLTGLAIALGSVVLVWLWGTQQLRRLEQMPARLLTASLIQGNIPQHEKWDGQFRSKVMQRYHDLSLQAAVERPDVIIWPEAATPGDFRQQPQLQQAVSDLMQVTGIPLLLGSTASVKLGREQKARQRLKNTVFLLDAQGTILASYDKMRLLPFGEYLPLEEYVSWPRWLVPAHGRFLAGTDPTVFELQGTRFGVVICWENFFSALFRRFVQAGAQFMVNPTNEAWFAPEASRQFLMMSVFRAVEHRMALLRVANTGISSLIDPVGRVQARVQDTTGHDVMVAGFVTVSVPAPLGPTVYTRWGDIFAMVCSGVVILILLSAGFPATQPRRVAR